MIFLLFQKLRQMYNFIVLEKVLNNDQIFYLFSKLFKVLVGLVAVAKDQETEIMYEV